MAQTRPLPLIVGYLLTSSDRTRDYSAQKTIGDLNSQLVYCLRIWVKKLKFSGFPVFRPFFFPLFEATYVFVLVDYKYFFFKWRTFFIPIFKKSCDWLYPISINYMKNVLGMDDFFLLLYFYMLMWNSSLS